VTRRQFSGQEVVKALRAYRYEPVGRKGSHVQLRYEHPDTGDVRNVTVPMYDEIPTDILQKIADQCGAEDFEAWCEWIETPL
jgi:predicted RNA binding protein YcfA (HicA-like mRNA interferase family)